METSVENFEQIYTLKFPTTQGIYILMTSLVDSSFKGHF